MSNKPALYANTKSIEAEDVEGYIDDNYDDIRDEADWAAEDKAEA